MPDGFPGMQHGGDCPAHALALSPKAPPPPSPPPPSPPPPPPPNRPLITDRITAIPSTLTISPGECKSSTVWLAEPVITPPSSTHPYLRLAFSSQFVTFTPALLEWTVANDDWREGKTVQACGDANAAHAHTSTSAIGVVTSSELYEGYAPTFVVALLGTAAPPPPHPPHPPSSPHSPHPAAAAAAVQSISISISSRGAGATANVCSHCHTGHFHFLGSVQPWIGHHQ